MYAQLLSLLSSASLSCSFSTRCCLCNVLQQSEIGRLLKCSIRCKCCIVYLMRRILYSSTLKCPHKIADFCTQVSGRRRQLQGPSSVMATSRWLGGARRARAWLIPSLGYRGVVDHEKVLEILACDGKVFTENSLGTELRATSEEHLEHLGAKP